MTGGELVSNPSWPDVAIYGLNMVQVVMLTYIAVKSHRNGNPQRKDET